MRRRAEAGILEGTMRSADAAALRNRLLLAAFGLTAATVHCGPEGPSDEPETVCLPPGANGECPSDEEALVAIEALDPAACPPYLVTPGATLEDGQCCYEVRHDCAAQVVGCNIGGRPLIIEGRPVGAAAARIPVEHGPRLAPSAGSPLDRAQGWRDSRVAGPDVAGLSAGERRLLALHWARIGAAEHASIAGFQRFSMDLLACGAPAELVAGAQRAALDEVRHARLAFALASTFAGAPVGPAPLDLPAAVPVHRTARELALATAVEGCTVETLSAYLLAEALRGARDPAVVAALTRMRRDEDRHAELAWRTLAWALSVDPDAGDPVDVALERAIAGASVEGFASPEGAAPDSRRPGGGADVARAGLVRPAVLERFGLLRPSRAEACRTAAIRGVIEPLRRAALAAAGDRRARAG
jgi:hypothetical protein